ncbi:uncharacterized protein LOC129568368 isoform X2 [Sitodiplosis mosellana]|uniref:uncharacterized protein LOC129568368 isoform X2 n=1 Tax=Sitodiplosis mosellana TaxID=263140 RepID=UPI002443AF79|nr:uncharacterized protein LOC129568368 isoform X2 [Sitodiplosis mosellana]
MHAKKPQTRLAGSLAKSQKPKVKKPIKPNTASKQRPIPSSVKSVSSKKLTIKKSAKTKDECENNEKKSKSLNKTESSSTTGKSASASAASAAMGFNSSKEKSNNKKPKSERKSTTPIPRRKDETGINGEKKSAAAVAVAAVKDEKIIKSKELKNLDIQLCGYSSVAVVTRESTGSDSDTDRIIKASICENVKTKARAASATFNSSGNRSPSSVSSPGPNHSNKSAATNEKLSKNEAALKSAENKSDNKMGKKKETAKVKSPAKPKPTTKSAQDDEKNKRSTNDNRKTEGDKNANKSQKAKLKPTNESPAKVVAPVVSTEKRIEIKTQVDESKSLIDTIAEAINEVVKQYNVSNNSSGSGEATGPPPHTNNTTSTSTKPVKKDNKIVKTTKKKVLNEKKLDVIESASDLVTNSRDAIKTISKNAKAKQKLANDNKTDDKIGDQIKQSSEQIMDKETAAAIPKASPHQASTEDTKSKKPNDKANKCGGSKGTAKPKPSKKSANSEQTEAKGSKIIKIDLKSKKKVKSSLATVKSASLKSAAKQLQNKTTKELKVCQDDGKKNDEHKSPAEPDEMSDDDNLSLTELKAQLNSKSDAQKTESNAKSSNASTKLVNAASSSANKQNTAKSSNFKKPTGSSTGTGVAAAAAAAATAAPKKKLTNQKETGTATTSKSDVYEFHDANFSGDDTPYVHKKKREKIPSNAAANEKSVGKDDAKKTVEKSKTLPLKKQIRHKVMKETAKTTKTDPKPTSTSTKGSASRNSASDAKIEQGDNDPDSNAGETKKSTKVHANNGHKLAAKNRRLKLFGFYSGPKRHRMASLNALAKVQCLYENESRTAQELGFVKEPQNVQRMKIVSDADKIEPNQATAKSSHGKEKEVKADMEKKGKKPKKDGDNANSEIVRDDVAVNNRTLRKVPGVRGEGTMWEMENSSMDESDTEREETQTTKPQKAKVKKKPLPKKSVASTKKQPNTVGKDESSKVAHKKLKATPNKAKKKNVTKAKPNSDDSDNSSNDSDSDRESHTTDRKPVLKKFKKSIARKAATASTTTVSKSSDVKEVVVRKRMASLNASAMMAATYEVERQLDKCEEKMYKVSADADERITPPKKAKEIKNEVFELKDTKPVSTNVVIVQDTDVTITGVYVNSTLGSSQEAYCKMQYRVQSSVTEERLVRPTPQEPPKSYTPLSALSCMLPPDPHGVPIGTPSSSSSGLLSMPPPDCEPPYRYPPMYAHPPQGTIHPHLLQPPPPIHHPSSAFCPMPPQVHHDPTGYYQPAGPLINPHPHLVGGPQNLTKQPTSSPLDSESLQQSQQSSSVGEGPSHTFRYQQPPVSSQAIPQPQLQVPPVSPIPSHYSRAPHQMHCPTYPPSYYAYGQHPRDMCYSPPYQPGYYTPKVYPTAYRQYMPSTSYYQAVPPSELYEHPGSMHQSPLIPPPVSQQAAQSIPTSTAPIQPQPQQMQSPNTQLVPSIPNAPHLEPYPPYYTPGYNHGGGYTRSIQPPFIDSSPYQGSCPCPIQSFPKNVHIGPLIGSKTDKGPCQKNSSHLHDSALINPVQFKQENNKNGDLDIIVKPEIVDPLTQYDTNHKSIDSIDRSYEKIALVPQHHPNYTLNPKLLEQPEMSISPARGSIGPGIPKIQAGATQPLDVSLEKPISTSLNQSTPVTSRRARVGKSMAREMMLQSHAAINDSAHEMDMDLQGDSLSESKSNICASTPIKEQIHNDEYEKNTTNTPHFLSTTKPMNGTFIKQEDVKKECDDDVLLISDKSETDTISSDHEKSVDCIQIIDLSSDNGIKLHTDEHLPKSNSLKRHCENESSADEIIDLDEDNAITTVKRRKILEFHKNPSKKSPPNSYKNLIKPSDPKSYLRRADSRDKDLAIKCSTPRTDEQTINLTPNGSNEHDAFRNGTYDVDDNDVKTIESSENRTESLGKSVDAISLTMPSIADEFPQELSATEEENFMSHLDSNSEGVSKGYCSDNEVLSRKKERLKTKLQKCEGRSRSESKKCGKIPNGKLATKSEKSNPKSRKSSRDRSTSSSKSKERAEKPPAAKKAKQNSDNVSPSRSSTPAASKKKIESKNKKSKTPKTKKSCEKSKKTPENQSSNECDTDDALLDNESHIQNNNNNILLDKNNHMHLEALVAPTFNVNKSLATKKSKSRGSKFSNKKRHRARHPKHVEEVIIPRQTSAAPRWSNGWNWLGEPFQGKVFLNSDDHQVVRTRYPAMRHDCGDIIRPGDCVLLRAGSKKNELPYVAKVASLWENPEDGEMMMSLLWYYRPEHTEQGRQPTDCMDEVFASKHQDHNSVACIEDKCYVLTFNEYGRYRKSIRAIEQGIEEVPSIVPALKQSTGREVPLNTNSELILFCRRVYEFRLRRLIKNPS